MKNFKNNTKGFTLIEILVSITIIAIVFGVGVAGYRDYARGQQVENITRELRGVLVEAKTLANSGSKPTNAFCNPPNVLNGILFSASDGGNAYGTSYDCSGGYVIIRSVTLPSGWDLTRTGPFSFTLKTLGQGTTIPAGTSVIITITHTDTGKSKTVEITASGEIK